MRHGPGSLRRRALDAATFRALRMPRGGRDYAVSREAVPMRDGVELLTEVYAPEGEPSGTVLVRTPYGRTGLLTRLSAGYLATHGYRVVNQHCRGTGGSGGVFEAFGQEVADGADAVAWLGRQPWYGGRFALWGASYPGFTALAVLMDPPPGLATAVVAVTGHDNHRLAHGAGAFSLAEVVGLMDGLGHLEDGALRGVVRGVTAGRRLAPAFEELPLIRARETVLADSGLPFLEWLTAPRAEDPVWRSGRVWPALDRVAVPVLLQAGWQDPFLDQMLEQYEHLRDRGVEVGLTVGPWTHAEALTRGAGVVMAEAVDWLDEHLAGTGRRPRPSPVRIHVTGAREWRRLPTWPPTGEERVLFLQPRGGLAEVPPAPDAGPSSFTYDPENPTPAVGGRVLDPARAGRRGNRRLERRADVLTFTSAPLVGGLEVVGIPVVEVVHRTDNHHVDLAVRLCEVRRNGRSVNVSDGFRRLEPSEASGTVRLRLDPVAHRFRPGTRIRLQVAGGAHPRYARNLGTGLDPATSTDLAPSRRQVLHGEGGLSRVLLPCPGPVSAPSATLLP